MERRTFLTGVGTAGLASTVVIGSGAFSRAESQRHVSIALAEDPSAYLAMDECPALDSDEITVTLDDHGHLEVEGLAEAIRTGEFDNVFQVCNHGKEGARIWIEFEIDEYEDRLWFYLGDDPDDPVDSESNGFDLDVGECACIGIGVDAEGLEDLTLFDDEIVIHADVDKYED
ncbi:DUF1102 domain-containing protein [Natronosalvus vescus]|uniref:DUF1102 domain-containing protein n=1 Tax=Natronosalvus vescus TaxID=2953881 RepID=UPI002090E63D|nr:DUF1102 domain-containing protein [Natronosalvus vescus]